MQYTDLFWERSEIAKRKSAQINKRNAAKRKTGGLCELPMWAIPWSEDDYAEQREAVREITERYRQARRAAGLIS